MAKRILMAIALAGALLPLYATTITFDLGGTQCGSAGLCTSVADATTVSFDGFATSAPAASFTEGAATYSWSGGAPFVNGSVSWQYAAPNKWVPGDSLLDRTDYLAVGSPNKAASVQIDFNTGMNYFGFYLGSPDAYNHISFYDGESWIATYDGILDPAAGSWLEGDFVNFHAAAGTFNRILLTSDDLAFETDNHAYLAAPDPAPEPGTLLGLAGGLACLILARLKRKQA